MEQPILRLGLIGFTDSVSAQISDWLLNEPRNWPRWCFSNFDHADAWIINGSSIHGFTNDELLLKTNHPTREWLHLNPAKMTRPVAFAGRLPSALEIADRVDFSSHTSIRQQLRNFEAWLRPLRAQFTLGADVLEREAELGSGIYHVNLQGHLLAVIDTVKSRMGLAPTARPVDLTQATWDRRPMSADLIPDNFIKMSLGKLKLIYATRTQSDILPPSLRTETLYPRRELLQSSWMEEEHWLLLQALHSKASSFEALMERTGMPANMLAHYLAPLHFAKLVTTKAQSALKDKTHTSGSESVPASAFGADSAPHVPTYSLTAASR